ncbi:MAG: RluA family pseudouridine synthase, partial [Oscillospiraceae bacterium]
MKFFEIKSNDENQRLDKFLQKAVPLLPHSLMYKYIRLKRIKVNGKKSDISYKLRLNDKLELYINDEFFIDNIDKKFLNVSKDFGIIYEDKNILLVDKPSGLVVHEDNENSLDTLINRVLHYLYDNGEYSPENEASFIPALCNRIDRNTAGIVIVAKNSESLRVLNEKIRNREIRKFYLCVVAGHPKATEKVLKHFQIKRPSDNTVTVFDAPQKEAKTML